MSGIYTTLKTCLPIIGCIIAFIAFVYLIYYTCKKYPQIFWSVIIASIVVGSIMIVMGPFLFGELDRVVGIVCDKPPTRQEWIVYDTDPHNDDFIKGTLSYKELKILDAVLMQEKKTNNGMRLDNTTLNQYAKYEIRVV